MTVEDEETYNQDCENALFRIRILELRAKLHEDEAMKKYISLSLSLIRQIGGFLLWLDINT